MNLCIYFWLDHQLQQKTMFIKSLMKLNNSFFTDGGNSTKAGTLEYIFDNKPTYLLIDEIDKMSTKELI